MTAKFPLGQTVITRTALERLDQADAAAALARHAVGDWGEVDPADREEKGASFQEQLRAKCAEWWTDYEASVEGGQLSR